MKNTTILFAAIVALVSAQDIDDDDVPRACRSICDSIVKLTEDCDNKTDDDDEYLDCVCKSNNASTQIPSCAACIAENGGDRDNDAVDIVTSCGFQTTSTYQTSTSTQMSGMTTSTSVPTTTAASQTPSMTGGAAQTTGTTDSQQQTTSTASTGGSNSQSSGTNSQSAASQSAASGSSSSASGNVAVATVVPMLQAGAGMLLAMGMM